MRNDFRDRSGHLIGYTTSAGRLIEARNPQGHLLGWFDTASNETRNPQGHLIAKGNMLSSLF